MIMEESKTLDFVKIGKAVNVILKNGRMYRSKLKSFDIHTKIVLENCGEFNQGKIKKRNEVFVVGRNLESRWLNENR